MVRNVTSFGRSGLYDWLVQRISAVILMLYTFCLGGFIVMNPDMDYAQWQAYFSRLDIRIFTLLCIVSLCAHAWVGLWTIATDYLNETTLGLKVGPSMGKKAGILRVLFQLACVLILFIYFVWSVQILWGA